MFLLADISDSIDRAWDEFFIWLPRLLAFVALVVIGYVTKGERAKDDIIRDVRTGVQRGKAQPSEAATRIEWSTS